MDRVGQFAEIQATGLELFKRKNKDYADAFADLGTIGVMVRINDKLKRYLSITKSGIQLVNDETLYDTLLDLHNYAAMAIMLLESYTPGE